MLPSLGRLSLRQCVPTGVNFADAQQAECELCGSAMHAPLSGGMTDPRLGLEEFKEDEEVRRWSWDTAVLRCGHRFHRRCLATFDWGAQGGGQRLCPAAGGHEGPWGPPLSPDDNADLNADIAAQLNRNTNLNEQEQARYDGAIAIIQGGASVIDPTAAIAQAQAAKEEARAADARYREVQKALEDAKKDYEALKAQATRLAQQPPTVGRQSSAETLALRDNLVTLQELLRQQELELDELRGEQMVRENADAEIVNEANRQMRLQGMEAERLRQRYAEELGNVARLEAEQRRLETSRDARQLRGRAGSRRARPTSRRSAPSCSARSTPRAPTSQNSKRVPRTRPPRTRRRRARRRATDEELEELRAKVEVRSCS